MRGVTVYFIAVAAVFVPSFFVLTLEGKDLETCFTAVAATFNNIGPGLSGVRPMANYGQFTPLSKIVMIFDMLAGRLEIFPMLLLFYPPLWREMAEDAQRRMRRAARKMLDTEDRK